MAPKRWIALGSVAAVAALLFAGTRGEPARTGTSPDPGSAASEQARADADATGQPSSRPRREPASAAAPEREPSAAGDDLDAPSGGAGEARGASKVDVKRVEAALKRFNEVTSRITQEELDAERERIKEASERLSAIEAPDPEAREIEDDGGFRWVELKYPSGEVRYELPP